MDFYMVNLGEGGIRQYIPEVHQIPNLSSLQIPTKFLPH